MRGYFGIGVERLSKPLNAGNLFRSAHAFGASFVFTIAATWRASATRSDTSQSADQVPYYEFASVDALRLPSGCRLVGIELMDESDWLPSFRHPSQAAYVLGPERGSLSPELVARCDHLVKIPTKFCVNVGVAGAIVMYDRVLTLGRHAGRPGLPGAEPLALPQHIQGKVRRRTEE